jgi:hypothetical protein
MQQLTISNARLQYREGIQRQIVVRVAMNKVAQQSLFLNVL